MVITPRYWPSELTLHCQSEQLSDVKVGISITHGALTQTGHDNVATEGRFSATNEPFVLKFDMVLRIGF